MVGQGGGGGTLCVAHKERRETRVKKSKIQKFEISLKTQIQKSEGKTKLAKLSSKQIVHKK